MVAPKRLVTLDARTDAIAERIKRGSPYGYSHWVRCRLIEAAGAEGPNFLPAPVAEREELLKELNDATRRARVWARTAQLLMDALGHSNWMLEDFFLEARSQIAVEDEN